MSAVFRLSALATSLALAACAVGPDYERPASVVSARFARDESQAMQHDAAPAGTSADADAAFWRGFGDPALTRLIDAALAANQDLQLAVSRYDASNALLRETRFDQIPTITASGQIGHRLTSKDQAFGAPRDQRDKPTSSVGINAAWELDLFGRVRRAVEAQRAETAASAADVRALRIAIAGEVARAYVDLRGSQERLRIARENADNQRQTLALIDARARAQVESTTSRIAVYEAAIGVDEHRLAVLTGQPPGALIGELDAPAPLPALVADIDPGTPGDLLRRRPDVAAAEARLHAATARVGVATADLFPRFTLTGLLGSMTSSYGFFRSGSDTNLIALGVDWSFLDVGRVRARLAANNADAAGQLAQYRQTVLGALEETENALLRVARTRDETAHLERAATDSARAAQLAHARFTAGAIDYYEVLDAERTLLQAQDAAADGRLRSADATVALYKALAGGWPSGAGRDAPIARR
ncbi:RND transporter [Burkholderia ubonensis]|uniref:efflux transporter outer membrane subunit n=1 Tax=Burkholderia ubonensis TaxID=101571 RepID=UPI0007599589|nr:efflux transporter outer membrane subunit [Burkholderia ubonensis]KVR25724.1 RND transporter [Burkholderia ubonensis]KWC00137.1 RND transporter [Burkholderia ubonensis]KWC42695.1 RND transporter [Burkholderia ubonensis]